jgi:hypothetical protein
MLHTPTRGGNRLAASGADNIVRNVRALAGARDGLMAAKSNHRFRSRGGPKTHVAQLQQGLTKFGVKSATWIVATASSRVAFDLAATPESADKALNYMNKKPSLGICATVLGVLRARTCRAVEASRGAGLAFRHKSRRGTGLGGQVTTGRKRGPDATPLTKAQEKMGGRAEARCQRPRL